MTVRQLSLVALILAGCRNGGSEGDDNSARPLAGTRVPVTVARVVRDTIADEITVVGRVVAEPGSSARLTAPAAGVVTAVRVQVGSEVRRGTLLLQLDVPEAAADLAARRAAADAAEREAARLTALYDQGVTSGRALEEGRAAASSARAALEAAQALSDRTRVRSPLEGGVQNVFVQPGERVEAGASLADVVDADTVDVVAVVTPPQLMRLRRGQAAAVRPDDMTRAFHGRVVGLSPAVDSLSGAGTAVIRVPNPGERLLPGSGASATITLGVLRDVLIVPEAALVLEGDSLTVFLVRQDSTVTARRVVVGARRGGRAQVTGAFQPGDRVVATGAFGLVDGMRVVPRDTAP